MKEIFSNILIFSLFKQDSSEQQGRPPHHTDEHTFFAEMNCITFDLHRRETCISSAIKVVGYEGTFERGG